MAKKRTPKPPLGEETRNQGRADVIGSPLGLIGFATPPGGSYNVYRLMRANPTIAIARIAATAPIRGASYSVEARKGTPDERVEFIREEVEVFWPKLLKDVLLALDYGWQSFEKVFEVRKGKLVYRKLKPLKQDITKVWIDKATGTFLGLRQPGLQVPLPPEKCFIFTNEQEAGNFYGRSRHENIRKDAWHPWNELSKKLGQYVTKVAGVIPMIEYPQGVSEDASGAEKDNYDLAVALLRNLGLGHGVAMPNVYSRYADDLIKQGVDIQKLKAWSITFLETKGMHGREMTNMMKHLESLMLRGWLVPERAVIEGKYGTKAEAVEHGHLALSVADLLFVEIVSSVNRYILNPLLIYNYGEDAKNSVYIVHSGLDPSLRRFFREMVQAALGAPANVDLLLDMVDLDALLDQVGLPKGGTKTAFTPPPPAKGEGPLTMSLRRIYRGLYDSLD